MSEQDIEKVDSGRRDFLKKSIAAGAVVWGAPAVTSLPGGRAWAQTYEPTCPPGGVCTVDAFGLQITVPAIGTLTFPSAPGPSPTCVVNPTVPPIINLAATICGDVDPATCSSSGYVENLDLDILSAAGLPILSLQATVLRANAAVSDECPPCATTGNSVIAGVVINGGPINVTSPCNTFIPVVPALPIAELHLNEQVCDTDGNLTVNALRLVIPSLGIEVIAGQAQAGREGCDCVTCT